MSNGRHISRRGFLKMTSAAVAGLPLASRLSAADDTGKETGKMDVAVVEGEPYSLAGKRLVFTNWYYIRPGAFGWYDDSGKSVAVVGSEGPWGAHLRRYDCPTGIRLVSRKAQRQGRPVIEWDDPGIAFGTVIRDGSTYRAWLASAYFESDDGLNWKRPELGIVESNGSRKNNLLEISTGGGTVFRDPTAPEGERYKLVIGGDITREQFEAYKKARPDAWNPRAERPDVGSGGTIFCVKGAVSPDGLRWTWLPDPLTVEHSDTQITGYYDEQLGKCVVYTRNYMIGPQAQHDRSGQFRAWWDAGRRSIGRTESADFRHFPLSEVILEPGPEMLPSDLLYTNCKTTIPGAPDHHLLFPAVWHAAVDDTTSIWMASSHNGRLWHYVPGGSVQDTAPFGEWDGGCVFASPNLIELKGGDWALPYTGYLFPHKYPRGQWKMDPGYAIWPKGRLAGVEAEEVGEFATVAIVPPGRKMRINAVTSRAGSVLAEVADLDRNAIAGHTFADAIPIRGDQHWTPVTWKGTDDLGHKDGTAIVLRFKLDGATVYGLEFE